MNKDHSLMGSICNKTGISKRQLAKFIGADQSQMSKYAIGTRTLPTYAILEMNKLHIAIEQLPPSDLPKPNATNIANLLEHASWCRTQCYPLQKKLDAMKLGYQQAATFLNLLNTGVSSSRMPVERGKRWIEEQRYQAEKQLEKNGWFPQHTLAIQIAQLLHEAELYESAASM